MAATALRFILIRDNSGRTDDRAPGILYNDGMVLGLELEGDGFVALVPGASLLSRGKTFTNIAPNSFPFGAAVQACTIVGQQGEIVRAMYYVNSSGVGNYFFRNPNNEATKRNASTLLNHGAIIASRQARGYAWG
jgi:hypothetical protein